MSALSGRTPFVGRARELVALTERLEAAAHGRGAVLALAGEAGIGKSRLVAEARACATDEGFLVLEGACFEQDGALPYAPLLDLLRAFLARRSDEEIARLLGPAAPELVKLLPELAGRLPAVTPAPALDPEPEKRRLFHTLIRFLSDLATQLSLLVVIEDLHWSDDTSLEFLLQLARHVPAQPILLLLTYRSDEVGPVLGHALAELERQRLATELPLARFDPAGVDRMVRAIFEQEQPVRAEFLEAIYALTEGNPFFIEEVLKALVAAGDIFHTGSMWDRKPLDELRIPRTVQDAVMRRSAQLSEPARQALVLAAVAGQRFDFALLQELTEQDERALLDLLRELIAAQLMVEESDERFAFRHALTREAVCAGLLGRERRALHGRIAVALERLYAGAPDVVLADLAYHSYEAGAWEKALDYATRVGERAQAMYAPRAAVEHFNRALDSARSLGAAPPPALYRARGQAYETLGDFERARADYEAALEAARAAGDGHAEWQALSNLGELWASRDYVRTGAYYREALDLARRMEEPATLGHSLNRLGNWFVNAGRPDEGLRRHQEALAIFESLAERRDIAATLDLLGLAAFEMGEMAVAADYFQRAVALFRELDDRRLLSSSLATLAQTAGTFEHDASAVSPLDPRDALAAAEEALRIAREIGWRAGEAYALIALAAALGGHGEPGRALAVARGSLAIAEEIEHQQWKTGAHCVLGRMYADLLAHGHARTHLERGLALAGEIGSIIWRRIAASQLGAALLAQGDLARCQAVLTRALDAAGPSSEAIAWRLCRCVLGELHLAQGNAADALAVTDRLLGATPDRTPRYALRSVWKLRGEALAALGRPAEAEEALCVAAAAAEEQQALALLWQVQVSLGRFYQAQRRPADAERAFADARATIDVFAARVPDEPSDEGSGRSLREHFLQTATALLPQPRPLTPLRAAKEAYGGLTSREREVATLVARGRSNREIADALVLGERTIETHVGNILAKLGFTSRAQIAAWTAEKGLLQES